MSISFPSLHCSRHWLQLHRNVRDYGPRHHQKLCPLHHVPDLPINHDRGLFCSGIRSRDKSARGNVADEYAPPSLLPYTYNTDHCATKTERLVAAILLFAIGQIFNFVISVHLCNATSGKIDGALFETAFTLCAVVMLWFFWSSITEDEWPDDPMNPMMSESGMPYA